MSRKPLKLPPSQARPGIFRAGLTLLTLRTTESASYKYDLLGRLTTSNQTSCQQALESDPPTSMKTDPPAGGRSRAR